MLLQQHGVPCPAPSLEARIRSHGRFSAQGTPAPCQHDRGARRARRWECASSPSAEHCATVTTTAPLLAPNQEAEHQQQEQQQQQQGIAELRWPWRWGSRIRYLKAGTQGPALLLVHGFGVAAWHFERNLPGLAERYQVYAIDLLGQGASWPDMSRVSVMASMDAANEAPQGAAGAAGAAGADPSAAQQQQQQQQADAALCGDGPLEFSTDTWTDELADFVRQVVGQPAYVAGNSLGGYLAVSLAARHPELVKGLVLLNATPFWSFRPPKGQPQGFWSFLPPPVVPVPQGLKRTVERIWWDQLRSRKTVNSMLGMVYVHKPVVMADSSVAERIIGATEHPAALDAFVSIVSAHKPQDEFEAMLTACQCRVCLVYGRQDPWVVPVWGQRAKHVLSKHGRPPPMYLELDGAGHCPHHEAPRATNLAITSCVDHMEKLASLPQQPQASPPSPSPSASSQPAHASSATGGSQQQPSAAAGHSEGPAEEAVLAATAAELLPPPFAVGARVEVHEEDEASTSDDSSLSAAEEADARVGVAASTAVSGTQQAVVEEQEEEEEGRLQVVSADEGGAVVRVRRRRRTVVLEHVDGRPRILPERVSHWIWGFLERGSGGNRS